MRTSNFLILIIGLIVSLFVVGSKTIAETAMTLESSVFTFDGKDFTRKLSTFLKEDGTSAVNTKLDHTSPAYKPLLEKHSYSGEVSVFGHKCDGNYAPLTDQAGNLTGAIMVCKKK